MPTCHHLDSQHPAFALSRSRPPPRPRSPPASPPAGTSCPSPHSAAARSRCRRSHPIAAAGAGGRGQGAQAGRQGRLGPLAGRRAGPAGRRAVRGYTQQYATAGRSGQQPAGRAQAPAPAQHTGRPEPMNPVDRLSQRFSVTPVASHFHCGSNSEGRGRGRGRAAGRAAGLVNVCARRRLPAPLAGQLQLPRPQPNAQCKAAPQHAA